MRSLSPEAQICTELLAKRDMAWEIFERRTMGIEKGANFGPISFGELSLPVKVLYVATFIVLFAYTGWRAANSEWRSPKKTEELVAVFNEVSAPPSAIPQLAAVKKYRGLTHQEVSMDYETPNDWQSVETYYFDQLKSQHWAEVEYGRFQESQERRVSCFVRKGLVARLSVSTKSEMTRRFHFEISWYGNDMNQIC